MPESCSGSRRVFFAVWPCAGAAAALDRLGQQLHQEIGGRRMRRDTLHVTLVFVGAVADERVAILRQAAGQVDNPAFALRLDRLECRRRGGIAWAGCSAAPLQLLMLASRLSHNLEEFGLAPEGRQSIPHLTLLRNARVAPMPQFEPIGWRVSEFTLVESRPDSRGAHYAVIDRWPLKQTDPQLAA